MTTNNAYASRTIIIYHDDTTDPTNPGWVTRCTEHDADGNGIAGRIAMDEQLDATNAADAQREAAEYWGCDVKEVERYEGPV